MEYGICVASRPQDVDYVVEAEQLGFGSAWFADSQMIWSDVYAVMALAAARTTTMRIGTGVAVAGTRLAPVTAAALGTINEIAPGRVFCGIGTGNTAMRIMGHHPLRLAEFEEYLEVLAALLRGDEVEYSWRDRTSTIAHVMPDAGFVRFRPRIPIHVSAFGPKALAVAARRGEGLITSVPPFEQAVAGLRSNLDTMLAAEGRPTGRENFPLSTLTTACVLQPGEPTDSPRVKEQVGAFAMAALHYVYEQYTQFGRRPPEHVQPIWSDYLAALEEVPPDRRHLRTHLGHNCWVIPEEERFVTKELIEMSCLVGTAEELGRRVDALDEAGLDQLVLLPPLAEKETVIADVARVLIDR